MSICAWCTEIACAKEDRAQQPRGCPMASGEWLPQSRSAYALQENRTIAQAAAHTEKTGYCQWTRLEEIAQFAQYSNYNRIGLAFCSGLHKEARIVADFFKSRGLAVFSAICCMGGIDKAEVGIPPQDRFSSEGFEAMCNPIGQANLLNEVKTDFNVVLGLCVGHDSLFFRYSAAPVTVLAAKDRVLGHNPLAAVYCAHSYYKSKLSKPSV
ncbi:MAG TPA: DUF1847 domain-containing protein [Bacillota bacterium]|nr:DUF1847 domain-containing protein [Bacillota bacterium]